MRSRLIFAIVFTLGIIALSILLLAGGAGIIQEEPGSDHPNGWLIKLDANGDEQWNRTLWGMGFCIIELIQQTTDGGYILAGSGFLLMLIKTDANGSMMWLKTKKFKGKYLALARSARQTADRGYIIAGESHTEGGCS